MVLTSRSKLEPAASRIAPRFANTCSVCSVIASRHELLLAGLERELSRYEHESVRLDRLRVRRALKRGRRVLGADDLFAHSISPPCGGRQAWPIAAPSALKIAASTCSVSRPSRTRIWTLSPAPAASSLRKRATTSLSRPPTRCPEKSTFETTSGRSRSRSSARERLVGGERRPAATPRAGTATAPRAPRRARARRPRPPRPRCPARPRG